MIASVSVRASVMVGDDKSECGECDGEWEREGKCNGERVCGTLTHPHPHV